MSLHICTNSQTILTSRGASSEDLKRVKYPMNKRTLLTMKLKLKLRWWKELEEQFVSLSLPPFQDASRDDLTVKWFRCELIFRENTAQMYEALFESWMQECRIQCSIVELWSLIVKPWSKSRSKPLSQQKLPGEMFNAFLLCVAPTNFVQIFQLVPSAHNLDGIGGCESRPWRLLKWHLNMTKGITSLHPACRSC